MLTHFSQPSYTKFQDFAISFSRTFPGPTQFSRAFQGLEKGKKFQDFQGPVATLHDDLIWRALSRAGMPSINEPHGLTRLDG